MAGNARELRIRGTLIKPKEKKTKRQAILVRVNQNDESEADIAASIRRRLKAQNNVI